MSLTATSLLAALESGRIDPKMFSHAAHVEAAWQLLDEAEFGEAVTRMSRALKGLTMAVGRPEKYHETITVAFLALVAERRAAWGRAHTFAEFRARNADLFDGRVLAHYYDRATLDSALARRTFVLPRRSQPAIGTAPATMMPSVVSAQR